MTEDNNLDRLRKPLFDDPGVMKRWGLWRRMLASRNAGSLPRDSFEAWLEELDIDRLWAAGEIERLRAGIKVIIDDANFWGVEDATEYLTKLLEG